MHGVDVPFVVTVLVIGVIREWVRGVGIKMGKVIGIDAPEGRMVFQFGHMIEDRAGRNFQNQTVKVRRMLKLIAQAFDQGFTGRFRHGLVEMHQYLAVDVRPTLTILRKSRKVLCWNGHYGRILNGAGECREK